MISLSDRQFAILMEAGLHRGAVVRFTPRVLSSTKSKRLRGTQQPLLNKRENAHSIRCCRHPTLWQRSRKWTTPLSD